MRRELLLNFYNESNEANKTHLSNKRPYTVYSMCGCLLSVLHKSEAQKQNKDGSDIAVWPPGIVAVQWRGGEPDRSS